MKVYINDKDRSKPRKLIEAELVKEFPTYFLVKLPDGNIIKRKKNRDILSSEVKSG